MCLMHAEALRTFLLALFMDLPQLLVGFLIDSDTGEQTTTAQVQNAGPIMQTNTGPIMQIQEQEDNAEAIGQQVQLANRPKRIVTKPSYLKDYV